MKRLAVAAAAAAFAFGSGPVCAQNSLPAGTIGSMSADDVIKLFASAGATADYVGYENETHFVRTNVENHVSHVGLRSCDGAARSARCKLLQPYALFSSPGLTLAQVNEFNLRSMNISTVMLNPDQSAMVGAKFNIEGGVTEANVRYNLAQFFTDISAFSRDVTPGTKAQVRFDPASHDGYVRASGDVGAEGAIHINGYSKDVRAISEMSRRLLDPSH
jgi:hypothetical protein